MKTFVLGFILAVSFGQLTMASDQATPLERSERLEALLLEKARLSADIRDERDLAIYLQVSEEFTTPLTAFSQEGLEVFADSLVFTSHGLASFNRDILLSELSAGEAREVMSLFGVSSGNSSFKSSTVSTTDFYCDTSSMGGGNCDQDPPGMNMMCMQGDNGPYCAAAPGYICNPLICQ